MHWNELLLLVCASSEKNEGEVVKFVYVTTRGWEARRTVAWFLRILHCAHLAFNLAVADSCVSSPRLYSSLILSLVMLLGISYYQLFDLAISARSSSNKEHISNQVKEC